MEVISVCRLKVPRKMSVGVKFCSRWNTGASDSVQHVAREHPSVGHVIPLKEIIWSADSAQRENTDSACTKAECPHHVMPSPENVKTITWSGTPHPPDQDRPPCRAGVPFSSTPMTTTRTWLHKAVPASLSPYQTTPTAPADLPTYLGVVSLAEATSVSGRATTAGLTNRGPDVPFITAAFSWSIFSSPAANKKT